MARGIRIDREVLVDRQVEKLCENFDTYLAEFNGDPPFRHVQWYCHKRTIELRKDLGGVAKSIDSDEYLQALYTTLDVWGMNGGWERNGTGAMMQEYDKFAASIRKYKSCIVELEWVSLAEMDENIMRELLWGIIEGMQLSQRKPSQAVTGAKTLHHLLPRLMPPIDRQYTRRFFRYNTGKFQKNQEDAFKDMIPYFKRIARRVCLEWYVGRDPWATSESKLIDNAIIGYCRLHDDDLLK